MSSESMLWVNTDTINSNGNSQFLHLTREGLCFGFGDRATVTGWVTRIRNGEPPESVASHLFRWPWARIGRFEWTGDDVEINFATVIDGNYGDMVQTFEAGSRQERDAILDTVRSLGIYQPFERQQTPFEIVKGPVVLLGCVVFLLAGLFWGVGQHAEAGSGRTRARLALLTGAANFLGYGGISAIAVVSLVVFCASVAWGLRNPPTMHTLALPSA